MRGYKGFDEELKCRGYQYKVGRQYTEQDADICNYGFHACEAPLDVFAYYPPCKSRYCEVDLDANEQTQTVDSKRVGKHIKIDAEIGIPALVKAHFEYVNRNVKESIRKGDSEAVTAGVSGAANVGHYGAATAGNHGAASAGYMGAATAGASGAATAGFSGAATAGDSGAAKAGNYGAATAGDSGAAIAGNYGAATAGVKGAASAGSFGIATAGEYGAASAGAMGVATSRGKSSTDINGLSVARGKNVKVKGGIGAILVIAEEKDSCAIKEWHAAVVDGKKIKADVWYKLKDGKFIEA